jgi:hypothetical protein
MLPEALGRSPARDFASARRRRAPAGRVRARARAASSAYRSPRRARGSRAHLPCQPSTHPPRTSREAAFADETPEARDTRAVIAGRRDELGRGAGPPRCIHARAHANAALTDPRHRRLRAGPRARRERERAGLATTPQDHRELRALEAHALPAARLTLVRADASRCARLPVELRLRLGGAEECPAFSAIAGQRASSEPRAGRRPADARRSNRRTDARRSQGASPLHFGR